MQKNTFYSALFIFIIVLVSALHACAQDNSQMYSFFFEASSSELHAEDINTIDSLYSEGWVAVAAVGIANQLPNTRRSLTNDSLAVERALAIQNHTGQELDWYEGNVMISSSKYDRRVDVIFTKSIVEETIVSADSAVADVDTLIISDIDFAENNIDTEVDSVLMDIIVNRMPLPNTDTVMSYDTISIDTITEASKTIEEVATDNVCECVEANTVQLWETYKQLQGDAKIVLHAHGLRSREYKDITHMATETRKCWEFSRGVRSTPARVQKHCESCGKSGQMSSKRKKAKKGRRPFKTTKLARKLKNLKSWWTRTLDRVAPFRNC